MGSRGFLLDAGIVAAVVVLAAPPSALAQDTHRFTLGYEANLDSGKRLAQPRSQTCRSSRQTGSRTSCSFS